MHKYGQTSAHLASVCMYQHWSINTHVHTSYNNATSAGRFQVGDIILLVEAYELVSHGVAYIQKQVQVALRSLRANFDIFRENKLHKSKTTEADSQQGTQWQTFPFRFSYHKWTKLDGEKART